MARKQLGAASSNALDLVTRGEALNLPRSAMRRWFNGSQAAPDGSVFAVTMNMTDFTRGSTFIASGDGIQVNAAGLYLVTAEMQYVNGTSGARTGLIQVNNNTVREFSAVGTSARIAGVGVLVLAVNDTVRLGGYSTGSPTVSGSAAKDVGLTLLQLGS